MAIPRFEYKAEDATPSVEPMASVGEAVAFLRFLLEHMTAEQRLDTFAAIMEGYCTHCGYWEGDYPCQCWNDE